MTFWQSPVALVVAPAAGLAAGAWIVRRLLDHSIDRDLERYRNQLELDRIEYQTKLSAVHERRAQVIGELYEKLSDAHFALGRLTTPVQFDTRPYKDRRADSVGDCCGFMDYLPRVRIYLDADIGDKLDEVATVIHKVFVLFDTTQAESGGDPRDVGYSHEAWDEFEGKFLPAMELLEDRFRELLGTEPPRKV